MELSALYKGNSLYQIPADGSQTHFDIPQNYNKVAVLYEYEPSADMPADKIAYLNKIIEAGMKLNPSETICANIYQRDFSLQSLAETAQTHIVVVFGMNWAEHLHNTRIRKNQIVHLYGMKMVCTDTLDVIESNSTAKTAFWSQLKTLLV